MTRGSASSPTRTWQQAAQDPNLNFVPDPDALGALASHAAQIQASGEPALSATGKLAAGRTLVADVLVTLS